MFHFNIIIYINVENSISRVFLSGLYSTAESRSVSKEAGMRNLRQLSIDALRLTQKKRKINWETLV